jgi:acetaldehyde dehydrogenase
MKKTKVAVLGSGNIGTDLMMKLSRSTILELTTVIGIDPNSDGLRRAKEMGFETITNGIEGFLERPELAEMIFDATSAKAHYRHAKLLEAAGKITLDLTPAAVGPFVIPPVNLNVHNDKKNVNLVTCGGQATIPMVHAVSRVVPVKYAEIVATISSKSAGPGTRANIDEFTITTSRAIEEVGGAKKGKAIIILNPAEPPVFMRDTIYIEAEEPFEEVKVRESIVAMLQEVQSYVPGYRLVAEPVIDGNIITILLEVEGAGDYLPQYSGNLDIMTAAAVKIAEQIVINHSMVKPYRGRKIK